MLWALEKGHSNISLTKSMFNLMQFNFQWALNQVVLAFTQKMWICVNLGRETSTKLEFQTQPQRQRAKASLALRRCTTISAIQVGRPSWGPTTCRYQPMASHFLPLTQKEKNIGWLVWLVTMIGITCVPPIRCISGHQKGTRKSTRKSEKNEVPFPRRPWWFNAQIFKTDAMTDSINQFVKKNSLATHTRNSKPHKKTPEKARTTAQANPPKN